MVEQVFTRDSVYMTALGPVDDSLVEQIDWSLLT
jgi:hypothetical protein